VLWTKEFTNQRGHKTTLKAYVTTARPTPTDIFNGLAQRNVQAMKYLNNQQNKLTALIQREYENCAMAVGVAMDLAKAKNIPNPLEVS
jgi:hypothetical protein